MSTQRLSLKYNISLTLAANVFFTLCQWGILASLTKMSNPTTVGLFTLATALVTPFFFLAGMELRQGLTVDGLERFKIQDYFALRFYNSLLAIGLIALTVIVFYSDLTVWQQFTVMAFALVKFSGTQSDVNYGVYQRFERMDLMARSMVVRSALGLVAFIICFHLTGELLYALLAEAAAWISVVALMDAPQMQKLGVQERLKSIFGTSPVILGSLFLIMLPLGLSSFMLNFSISVPKLVIEHYMGLEQLGILGAILYIYSALTLVTNSIGRAASARLARQFREGRIGPFLKLTARLSAISGLVGALALVAAALIGEPILKLLYTQEYAEFNHILLITLTANLVRFIGTPLQFSLIAMQKYWAKFSINAVILVIAIAASMILIPRYGIEGAAWSVVAMAVGRLMLNIIVLASLIRRHQPAPAG